MKESLITHNEEYYEYMQALVDQGIELQFSNSHDNTTWVKSSYWSSYSSPMAEFRFMSSFESYPARYRLASHPEDCPPCGTQGYIDYWQAAVDAGKDVRVYSARKGKSPVGISVSELIKEFTPYLLFEFAEIVNESGEPQDETLTSEEAEKLYNEGVSLLWSADHLSGWYKVEQDPSNYGSSTKFKKAPIKEPNRLSTHDDALCYATVDYSTAASDTTAITVASSMKDEFTNELSRVASLLDTFSSTSPAAEAVNQTLIPGRETTMPTQNDNQTNIEIKINGKEIPVGTKAPKVKTDLQVCPAYQGHIYNEDGSFRRTVDLKSVKAAGKVMQQPENIGKTIILFKAVSKITTDIPLVTTEI